jgi:hypothetical protein
MRGISEPPEPPVLTLCNDNSCAIVGTKTRIAQIAQITESPLRMPLAYLTGQLSSGPNSRADDDRYDYGEIRIYAIGLVNGLEITLI